MVVSGCYVKAPVLAVILFNIQRPSLFANWVMLLLTHGEAIMVLPSGPECFHMIHVETRFDTLPDSCPSRWWRLQRVRSVDCRFSVPRLNLNSPANPRARKSGNRGRQGRIHALILQLRSLHFFTKCPLGKPCVSSVASVEMVLLISLAASATMRFPSSPTS